MAKTSGTEKCSTGTPGLDQVLAGGLPRHRFYLIQGDAGVGKTTLGLKFLLAGKDAGETCLYISLSETRSEFETVARSHGAFTLTPYAGIWPAVLGNAFEKSAGGTGPGASRRTRGCVRAHRPAYNRACPTPHLPPSRRVSSGGSSASRASFGRVRRGGTGPRSGSAASRRREPCRRA
jgi:hypothetical protein